MLRQFPKDSGWTLFVNPKQVDLVSQIKDTSALIASFNQLPITLKDNHRSLVKRGYLFDRDVVVKRPIDKNRRLFARLWSLAVAAEAKATINNLQKLQDANVPSVTPYFAIEKRVKGIVADSWFCYEYRAGQSCDESNMHRIVDFLQHMHKQGFRHGDPTWNNFLEDDNGELFTIDTKAKPCRGTYHSALDFFLLKHANKLKNVNISLLTNLNRAHLGYWLAYIHMSIKSNRTKLRDRLKKNRAKNNK